MREMAPYVNLRSFSIWDKSITGYDKMKEFRIINRTSVERHWHARTFNINLPISIANGNNFFLSI